MSQTIMNRDEAIQLKDKMVAWVKNYFQTTGAKGAVVGISGGKDSTVVSALLAEAIGKEHVFGVLMPNGKQADIEDSFTLVKHLGIPHAVVDIGTGYAPLLNEIARALDTKRENLNAICTINTAPRFRMTTLYAVAAELGYRVAGTGNRSEAFVGYFTKWGDGAHDFNILANLTTEEVVAVGHVLGLPQNLVEKAPTDGLSGLTDEENLGVSYFEINRYIENGTCGNAEKDQIISKKHAMSAHKREGIPQFKK